MTSYTNISNLPGTFLELLACHERALQDNILASHK